MITWKNCLRRCNGEYLPASLIVPPPQMPSRSEIKALSDNARRILLALWLMDNEMRLRAPFPTALLECTAVKITDAAEWTEIPLAVMGPAKDSDSPALAPADHNIGRAKICPVLLGLLPAPEIRIEPGWLTDESFSYVRKLLQRIGGDSFGYILLRRFDPGTSQIDGQSMGLPIAAAASRLKERKKWIQTLPACCL